MNRILKMYALAAGVLALGLLAGADVGTAEGIAVDFDQAIDVKGALDTAKENVGPLYRRDQDCADFTFYPGDPLVSERVRLESIEWEEVCHPTGHPRGGQSCHEVPGRRETRHVRVRVSGRGEMLPWERDHFRVCFDGWLRAWTIDASHAYQLDEPGWSGDTIEARAGAKVASLPDPAGIVAESFAYDAGKKNFVLSLKDRWSGYYAGETTVLELQLKRYHKNWFDGTVLKTEVSLPSAASYEISFADYAKELEGKLDDGKKYYVKWRLKRVGKVSKDKWAPYWETGKVAYASSAAGFSLQSVEAAKSKACWFKTIEKDQCVYRCNDGTTHTQPVREPDPFDREPGTTIPCPQLVIPFGADNS